MTPRLLLISYHFGPDCDTGGFRWNAITAYLARSGWEVEVISAARAGADQPYELVPGVRVTPVAVPNWFADLVETVGAVKKKLAQPTGEQTTPARGLNDQPVRIATEGERGGKPRIWHNIYSRLMANISASARWSAHGGWARRAVKAGIAAAKSRPVHVVAVSSPPHPTHLAGISLSRELGIPFIADFRDPWLIGKHEPTQSAVVDQRLGAIAQKRTYASASRIILNTGRAAQAAREHDSRLADRVSAIPNGYDPRSPIGRPDTKYFRIAFVGWLYDFMDPEPVLAACGRLRAREGLESLRVEFVGTSPAPAGVSLAERARAHGLEGYFEHRPKVPRPEALQVQERAAIQVVFDAPGPLRIPMKFYDAMQLYGDVLLIGWPDSALTEAAARVGLTVCHPDDSNAIDTVLTRALARWRARDYASPIDDAGVFARDRTSRQMLEHMTSLIDSRLRTGSTVPIMEA